MNLDTASARCLAVQGLSTRYGERIALNAVSFELAHGCLAVLLGPNGAGKSTLFQVLTGLFAADAGDVRFEGLSMRRRGAAALRHIGVVFQQPSLDLDLSVERNLRFHADLHGLPRALASARIAAGQSAPASLPTFGARCASSRAAIGARSTWCGRCCTSRRSC
jgi:ABC-2 type transport system ATP-binding protein